MALEVVRTDGKHPGFLSLVRMLDEDLNGRYGELQKSYDVFNSLEGIRDAIVVYQDATPAACGAFKQLSADTVEIKRVFVSLLHRRQGLARLVLAELEAMAEGKGASCAVLETGIKQTEAIALYRSLGYVQTDNYGQYAGNPNSVCMKKELQKSGSR